MDERRLPQLLLPEFDDESKTTKFVFTVRLDAAIKQKSLSYDDEFVCNLSLTGRLCSSQFQYSVDKS